MGELLKEFQNQTKGLRQGDEARREGSHPTGNSGPSTQREAAEQAGISKHQEKQARRVAEVPEDEFEEAVESNDPESVVL